MSSNETRMPVNPQKKLLVLQHQSSSEVPPLKVSECSCYYFKTLNVDWSAFTHAQNDIWREKLRVGARFERNEVLFMKNAQVCGLSHDFETLRNMN